jgi:hypothetical protein
MSALGQEQSFAPDPPNGRFSPKAVISLLGWRPHNCDGGRVFFHRTGALSGISIKAICPIVAAPMTYQAGAIALCPDFSISLTNADCGFPVRNSVHLILSSLH